MGTNHLLFGDEISSLDQQRTKNKLYLENQFSALHDFFLGAPLVGR